MDRIGLAVTIELPAGMQAHLAAARALKSQGLTVREVRAALGISHQRAQQLVSAQPEVAFG